MNGYQVCQTIRSLDHLVPIIMLTARGQEADKIRGLDAGADDYVTKPFSVGELVARIRAAVRRSTRQGPATPTNGAAFSIGTVTVDPGAHTLQRDGQTITISFYEAELLRLLYKRLGEPVSRDEILDKVWGTKAHQPNNRTVDNFVVKLRKKIEPNHDKPRHILTVYGYGYKLVP
jgi:DNA-binding response OmpR family regulator